MLRTALAHARPVQIGPYLLSECIGQGGMAVVYRATRQGPAGFEKTLVVKCMLPALTTRRDLVDLFFAEAKLSAQLNHPNIVQVHDFGVEDDVPYLVMEYLNGRNLTQLRGLLKASRARLPVGAALAIARDMSHALAYAHSFVDGAGAKRQVIHRDVSPSNVMVCRDGTVKLLDFGVAKVTGEFDYEVTQSFRGKYAYMAPEQVNREPIDRRVDVFAAGIVLHELLTGRRLFQAQSEIETLERVAACQVVAPSVDNPAVPRALDAIVKKALARDPAQRYASGGELAAALDELDGLALSRSKLKACIGELVPVETVICEVCGKAVVRGEECGECGSEAPLFDKIEEDQPAPLPPPPETPSVKLPPRLTVVRTPLPALEGEDVPYTDRVDFTPLETLVEPSRFGELLTQSETDENAIEPASLPPPAAPRLFVVPQSPVRVIDAEPAAPWEEPSESSLARTHEFPKSEPEAPTHEFHKGEPDDEAITPERISPAMAIPELPPVILPLSLAAPELSPDFDLRAGGVRWRLGIAIGVAAGLGALALSVVLRRAPPARVTPAPIAASAPISKPIASAPISKPIASAPISKPIASAPISKPIASAPISKPIFGVPTATPFVTARIATTPPSPVAVARQRAPVAAPMPAPRPRRVRARAEAPAKGTVKEGRLVDPFSGMD